MTAPAGWRRQLRRLAAAALILALGWLVTPDPVALYDGVGLPDQAYRHLGQSGLGNPPSGATATAPVAADGSSARELRAVSDEQGPQVLVEISPGGLSAPGARTVTVTATPATADQPPPDDRLDSNIYTIDVTADPSPGVVRVAHDGLLLLRAAVMTSPDPQIVYRTGPGAPWRPQPTTRAGQDVLGTALREVGDYAVLRPAGAGTAQAGPSGGHRALLLLGGLVVLGAVTLIALRPRKAAED